jgi:hypothetical protein
MLKPAAEKAKQDVFFILHTQRAPISPYCKKICRIWVLSSMDNLERVYIIMLNPIFTTNFELNGNIILDKIRKASDKP